jgi:hypothetical protein
MADQDNSRGLLWMFRHGAPEGESGAAALDPSGSLYTLFKNTQNPFLRRAVSGQPSSRRTDPELAGLVRFFGDSKGYELAPKNKADPYQRRQLNHPPPPPVHQPHFADPVRLTGDSGLLGQLVADFFRSTLEGLRGDPQSFAEKVRDLAGLLKANGIRLRVYEAYHALEDWNDLLDTLEEIAQYPSAETFDLFCSALLAYYDLVYGEPT